MKEMPLRSVSSPYALVESKISELEDYLSND